MATVKEYAAQLRSAARPIAFKMGVDLAQSSKETRVIIRVLVGIIATLIKALIDKGVLTDADLQAAIGSTAADTYGDEPVAPPTSVSVAAGDAASAGDTAAATVVSA